MTRLVFLTLLLLSGSLTRACNVPVFRYALERWRPDAAEVVVFLDSPLTAEHQTVIETVEAASYENGGAANLRLKLQAVDRPMDDQLTAVWENLNVTKTVSLPYMVLRSPAGQGSVVNSWHGPLDQVQNLPLLRSPARTELGRRLSSGDAAVWVVLKSGNAARDQAVLERLTSQLQILSEEIPLPEGIGLPGSELFSEIPLLMQFSVLEIAPDDVQEQILIDLLQGLAPESVKNNQPLVMPVFGRGRALEVISADQVTDNLITDLTLFLCGACSCQVKERNPGFDLLLDTNWNLALFGDDAEDIAHAVHDPHEDIALPVLLALPPGKADSPEEVASQNATTNNPPAIERSSAPMATQTATVTAIRRSPTTVLWILLGLVGGVMLILIARMSRG